MHYASRRVHCLFLYTLIIKSTTGTRPRSEEIEVEDAGLASPNQNHPHDTRLHVKGDINVWLGENKTSLTGSKLKLVVSQLANYIAKAVSKVIAGGSPGTVVQPAAQPAMQTVPLFSQPQVVPFATMSGASVPATQAAMQTVPQLSTQPQSSVPAATMSGASVLPAAEPESEMSANEQSEPADHAHEGSTELSANELSAPEGSEAPSAPGLSEPGSVSADDAAHAPFAPQTDNSPSTPSEASQNDAAAKHFATVPVSAVERPEVFRAHSE